jgi:HPt (histidine-containing phosphotransfer) domain-containing protein
VAHGKQYAQTSQSMSDALSDSARDRQRTEDSREMWQAFGAFAEAPSAERKQAVLEDAKAVDSINGGYRGGRTSRASRTAHRIEGIERGDPGTWARFR